MKKLLRYSTITLLIFVVFALTGCEKDDNGDGPDKKTLLTAHVWKYDKLTTTSTDSEVQLLINLLAAFMTNATANFAADGTYTITILDQPDSGTWELSADGTKLTFDKGTDDETVQSITTLTSDVLESIESTVDLDYGNFDVTYRWVK